MNQCKFIQSIFINIEGRYDKGLSICGIWDGGVQYKHKQNKHPTVATEGGKAYKTNILQMQDSSYMR